ncbi:MAG: hypothetical protein O3B21_02720 [Proteobacteria bacterium]|nr:hypothetical protein [Pseudomonadota bacterium]MDA1354710.1 hypothetical protein [Pseudomonadota bacterium]
MLALGIALAGFALATFFIAAGGVFNLAEDFFAGLPVAADFAAVMSNFTVFQFALFRFGMRRPAPQPNVAPEPGPGALRRMINRCRANKKWAGMPHPFP